MKIGSIEIPDDETEITMPTEMCCIVKGLDKDGEEIYCTLWWSNNDKIPGFITGLGMMEAAKEDFKERCDNSRIVPQPIYQQNQEGT